MLFPVFSTTGARRGRGNTPVVFPMMGSRGFIVEMDDFGSGYSSLNALKDIDIDKLKLDMRFLSGESSEKGRIIVRYIIGMAQALRLPIIAEGVETLEQAA